MVVVVVVVVAFEPGRHRHFETVASAILVGASEAGVEASEATEASGASDVWMVAVVGEEWLVLNIGNSVQTYHSPHSC